MTAVELFLSELFVWLRCSPPSVSPVWSMKTKLGHSCNEKRKNKESKHTWRLTRLGGNQGSRTKLVGRSNPNCPSSLLQLLLRCRHQGLIASWNKVEWLLPQGPLDLTLHWFLRGEIMLTDLWLVTLNGTLITEMQSTGIGEAEPLALYEWFES